MQKLTATLEKYLVPLADKLSRNRYLGAISSGFSVLLPIIMIGAIFTLLANLQIEVYQTFIQNIGLKQILSFAPKVTTDMLAVYASYLIAKACADNLGLTKESTIVGALSLFVFLLLIPLGVKGETADGVEVIIEAALSTSYLGSAGLFSAMIIALVVPAIYSIFIKKNITIKMPEQIPESIAKSFSALIPGFVIAFIFSVVRYGFSLTSYGHFNEFIYTILKTPLSALGASPFTFIVFALLCSILWFFGLHGGMIIMPFLNMLYLPASLENLAAYADGLALPNTITVSCWSLFTSLGGAGGTIGLVLAMFFFAKSARYKTLSKIALPAQLCGINEPVIFGVPMVLNTIMMIPFVLVPVITFTISYVCMSTGIVPVPNGTTIPLGTPVIFSGIVGCGWQGAVLQIVLIVVQFIIYFPFFKVLDKQALQEENNE